MVNEFKYEIHILIDIIPRMVKDAEPQRQRTWRFDNEFHPQSENGKRLMYRWSFDGEVSLSLVLIREPQMRRFEMARHLTNEAQADQMATTLQKEALTATKRGEQWTDVFWVGLSPEDLEKFCRDSLLPLPLQYQEAWEELA